MKKTFTFSKGIVLLIAIIFIVECRSMAQDPKHSDKTVKIYLRSIIKNGEKRLSMYDTNDSTAIDNLITTVDPGTTIIWILENNSRIKKVEKIYPLKKGGLIFKEDPQQELFGKRFKLKVPEDAPRGTIEKYVIEYIHEDDKPVTIDPFIRIPPPPN